MKTNGTNTNGNMRIAAASDFAVDDRFRLILIGLPVRYRLAWVLRIPDTAR
jgi:hypothetical protein